MSILALAGVLIILGLFLWAVGMLPLDPTIQKIIYVVIIVAAVLYVLQGFGILPYLQDIRVK